MLNLFTLLQVGRKVNINLISKKGLERGTKKGKRFQTENEKKLY